MSESKPGVAVVIVPGSFQKPAVYKPLSDGIRAQGYHTVQLQHPSCIDVDDPDFAKKDLDTDTSLVRETIENLVDNEQREVVVVMHSYGGLVGSNAIPEHLSLSQRQSQGLAGGVAHLFYFSAFIMGQGQSVLNTYGESPDDEVKDGKVYLGNAATKLYNDLPEEEAARLVSGLGPQSKAVQSTPITLTAYEHVPSTYLICENDKAVPPLYQEMFAKTAHSEIERCDAGHSPQLSQTNALVRRIVAAVERSTT